MGWFGQPSAPNVSGRGHPSLGRAFCRHHKHPISTVWHSLLPSLVLFLRPLRHWFLENIAPRFFIKIYSSDIPLPQMYYLSQNKDLIGCLPLGKPVYPEPVREIIWGECGQGIFFFLEQRKVYCRTTQGEQVAHVPTLNSPKGFSKVFKNFLNLKLEYS